jgi:hypothetical protein
MLNNFSSKELFSKIINFESSKRTIRWEFGYWGGTLQKWYTEGLQRIKGIPKNFSYGDTVFGPALHWCKVNYGINFIRDFDVSNYFNFDAGIEILPYNYWIYPVFEEKIIYEDNKYKELYDIFNVKKKIFKDDSSMPFYMEWPVKNRRDWEEIKEERFNLNSITHRYSDEFEIEIKRFGNRDFPLAFGSDNTGFFGTLRSLIGEVNLFLMYYDDPELILDIVDHLCNLWIHIAEELTSKINFDIVCFWEDMSGVNGSLISPSTFKEFMTPFYKKLINFLRGKGLKNFIVDTDGMVDELIPLFIEAGINGMYPFERQAKNDLLKIREKYPDLLMWGGFDKNTLYKGKEHIDKELEMIKELIKKGGYIPFADHLIPPNSSWENFKYYREKLDYIIDHTKVL